ncbi:hypothetical protein G7Y89_g7864 [Cudoniella acicularis]|uniref:Uncharacterized protein n=1 Tax=Cudoniella acicularis TaxID=354080 RepID=A0A8H4RHM2_9HELO|nr:hypothetical protein G7Y89_g7864 [Cudoniella acicularis]
MRFNNLSILAIGLLSATFSAAIPNPSKEQDAAIVEIDVSFGSKAVHITSNFIAQIPSGGNNPGEDQTVSATCSGDRESWVCKGIEYQQHEIDNREQFNKNIFRVQKVKHKTLNTLERR